MASVTPRSWPPFLPQMEGHGVISSMNGRAFESNGLAGASNGSCAIGVMAKTPRPGFSKTRLCPPLRPEQAAALSAAFLRDTTTNIAQAALSVPVTGYAAYAPSGTEEALISHVGAKEPSAFWLTAPHRSLKEWRGSDAASSMQSSKCSQRATPPHAY